MKMVFVMGAFTGFFALLTWFAVISRMGGNVTAINGIIGCGFWTVVGIVGTTVAWWEAKEDARIHRKRARG